MVQWMRSPMNVRPWLVLILLAGPTVPAVADELAALGRALFFDPNLSAPRTQSCATCHDPARAFIDTRQDVAGGAVSLGADGISHGTRNAPSIAYAARVPAPGRASDGNRSGGLFLDGRAATLEAQAAEPFTNPLEMAMPDHAGLLARVAENPAHVTALERHFGAGVLDTTPAGLAAITAALAAFERGPDFATFDSRYDRFLAGELELTSEEELGRRLFFSDLTNCMSCHLLENNRIQREEIFSDHRFHNIGIPANPALGPQPPDLGLGGRTDIAAAHERGKFRTPSLRNIAITAPYMHNGVFRTLEAAIAFYNQYIVDNDVVGLNPETGAPWGEPEVADTIATELLRQGQPIDATRTRWLIAFLRSLTDRRFEHLLPPLPAAHEQPCPHPGEEPCDE